MIVLKRRHWNKRNSKNFIITNSKRIREGGREGRREGGRARVRTGCDDAGLGGHAHIPISVRGLDSRA